MHTVMKSQIFLQFNFLLALSGMFGSLYFSEILKFPPCTLCWYQRICVYSLVAIFGVALWSNDKGYRKYSVPFVLVGLVLAIYHNLLYFGLIAEPLVPCTGTVSCSSKQLELFGFITIPLMALVSFILMLMFLYLDYRVDLSKEET